VLSNVRQRELEANGAGGASAAVVNLAERRKAKRGQSDKQTVANVVADGVIETIRASGQDILLSEGEVWIYADGIWHVMTPADQQWILTLIQEGFETLGEPAKPANLTATYKRLTEHPSLFKRVVEWASSDLIVCRNGVLEVESRKFHPHGPHWYARRKIGVEYDPAATCPRFCQFVASLFSDRTADAEAYSTVVQAWMGSAMAVSHLSREERKALILVGPSRTGKTELSRIIRLLIGDPIATPSVDEISERFGLSSLYDAAAWIRDDAINEGDDLDPQRFKTIVTGEPIDFERKHRPAISGVELALPVLLTTNALPKARDKSDAIFNRAIVLEMTNEVSEQAAHQARTRMGVPRGVTLGQHIMASEGPGILNWALEGLARLLERGSYDLPDSVRNTIQRFKDDNNPVGEWARAAIVKAPHGRVSRGDIMCAYHGWQREQDGDEARAFGARAFFPRLRAAAPWAGDMTDHSGRRYVTGLQLSDEGLLLWDLHNQGPQLKGGSKGTSLTKSDVNKLVQPATQENGNAPRF
jgi:P4 family phage/plasmid primase-like protien